jgi:AcrR family transcriptional regulator
MEPRDRIVQAAAALLAEGGRDAVTTRAVAARAAVQAPTIYRLFGDKSGLLDAVAEYGFTAYLERKGVPEPTRDPIEDLKAGWDLHIGFGLANPTLYPLMYGDPRSPSPAAEAAVNVLHERIRRIAAAGRLKVSEQRAANLVQAVGEGTVLRLLAAHEPDPGLADAAFAAVVQAIATDAPAVAAPGPAAAATALRASLDEAEALTPGERRLLAEWLERLAS